MDFTNLVSKYKGRLLDKSKILNLGIIILTLFIASNIYKSQAGNIASLNERKNTLLKKNAVLTDINQSEQKFNSYKGIINTKEISSVLKTLSNLAQDLKINIISLKPLTEETRSAYVKYPFKLAVEAADYHSIARFIAKLENSADIYIIDNISLSKRQAQDKTGKLNAEIRLSTILIK